MNYQAGDISLTELLNKQIASLYMSEQCSDITLYVKGQKIPAHRSIIGARCEYLNTFFSNGLNEPNQTKFDLDVPLEAFKILLKYFYTGQMSLSKITNVETLIQILNLVEEYCLFYLKTHFENYFKQIISVQNTCRLLEVAKTYELKKLKIKSLNLIDTNADQILASELFKKIPNNLLEEILKRDTFKASSELSIFRAIADWSKQANQNIETVIHLVKLPLIPLEELLQIRKLGTISGDKLYDAIEKQMTRKPAPRSDIKRPEYSPGHYQNVASIRCRCNVRRDVLKGGNFKYPHVYTEIIELQKIVTMNNIEMELVGYFFYGYCYYIAISTDLKNWERIIDYSLFECQKFQNLYFPAKAVKYFKIVANGFFSPSFKVLTFEAYNRDNIPEIRNGIVVRNEKIYHLDLDNNGKKFEVTLHQPYCIGSMRFHIVEGNSNMKYKFYIETSLNGKDWEEIAGKRDEFVNGLQSFRFTSKPVLYIRITPTDCNPNGALNTFRVYNFECPSSV